MRCRKTKIGTKKAQQLIHTNIQVEMVLVHLTGNLADDSSAFKCCPGKGRGSLVCVQVGDALHCKSAARR